MCSGLDTTSRILDCPVAITQVYWVLCDDGRRRAVCIFVELDGDSRSSPLWLRPEAIAAYIRDQPDQDLRWRKNSQPVRNFVLVQENTSHTPS